MPSTRLVSELVSSGSLDSEALDLGGGGGGQPKLSAVLSIHWDSSARCVQESLGVNCREVGKTQFGIRLPLDVGTPGAA